MISGILVSVAEEEKVLRLKILSKAAVEGGFGFNFEKVISGRTEISLKRPWGI